MLLSFSFGSRQVCRFWWLGQQIEKDTWHCSYSCSRWNHEYWFGNIRWLEKWPSVWTRDDIIWPLRDIKCWWDVYFSVCNLVKDLTFMETLPFWNKIKMVGTGLNACNGDGSRKMGAKNWKTSAFHWTTCHLLKEHGITLKKGCVFPG